jgi:hypothetical protein
MRAAQPRIDRLLLATKDYSYARECKHCHPDKQLILLDHCWSGGAVYASSGFQKRD